MLVHLRQLVLVQFMYHCSSVSRACLLYVIGSSVDITGCNKTSSGAVDWQLRPAIQHHGVSGSETVQPSSKCRL